jgi:hypothetical protein
MRQKTTTASSFKPKLTALAISASLLLSQATVQAADNFSGTVKGRLSSINNADIAQVTISLTHKEKGLVRTVESDADGNYLLRKLPIGDYRVTLTKSGMQTQQFDISVKIGGELVVNRTLSSTGTDIERIAVLGSNINHINLANSEGGIVVTATELALLPINTGFNNIALLSPSAAATTAGNFRGAPSIGGSSSAENGYYLNGMNVTKIQTGLGSIDLPWEAIAQTEVKTGGVAPEFGSALGGIVNAISKSGSNELEFGAQYRTDLDGLSARQADIFYHNGDLYANHSDDKATFSRASIWASGALIKDQLFFYGLYAPQTNDYLAAHTNTLDDGKSQSDRWFAKLDWYINDTNFIEFTSINYENDNRWHTYSYDWQTNQRSGDGSQGTYKTGGDVYGIKYTSLLTDALSLEVIAGRVTDQTFNSAADALPWVGSYLFDSYQQLSNHTSSSITESRFTRDQLRADIMWDLEQHALKFGVDYYDTHVDHQSTQNGHETAQGWWYIKTATGTDHSTLPAGTGYVDQRIRTDFSDSHVKALSFYAQDSWQAADNLVLNLGLRYSNFSNEMSDGQQYVNVKGQLAPRLQAIYDLNGDGSSKVFATYGRYFQPVSANMNIVQGGSRRDEHWYYALGQVDAGGQPVIQADGAPSHGEQVSYFLAQSGEGAPGSKASADLKSMYSDEFTAGYQTQILDGTMTAGIRGIYRDLKRSIEDADLQTVLKNWYLKQGISADGWIDGWILFNPGSGLDVNYDFNGDGNVDHIQLTKDEVGQVASKRTYTALEFTLNGQLTERMQLNASYTWSHLYGNTAGLVNDDDNQADPGWTISYDYAGLQDHAYGNLPADHRHALKLFGSYQVTDKFVLGINTLISSGKPMNKMGIHPSGIDSCAEGMPWQTCPSNVERGHGSAFYDELGQPSPRGSAGTTAWLTQIDLSASYRHELFGNPLTLKATVYNLFNSNTQSQIYKTASMTNDNGEVVADPNWGMTTARQAPRYVSLVARYDF